MSSLKTLLLLGFSILFHKIFKVNVELNFGQLAFRIFEKNRKINGTNQMVLVSFKNIHIWPSYGQKMACMTIFGYTFFGHNSAIFWPIGLKFCIETPETIINRLVAINPSCDAYFLFSFFWAIFGGKIIYKKRLSSL